MGALQVGLNSKVNWGWCDKQNTCSHLSCIWTARLYHIKEYGTGVKRQGGLNVERWTADGSPTIVTKGCRVHLSNCRVPKEL